MAPYQGTFGSIKEDLQLLLRLADADMTTAASRWINLGQLDALQRTEGNQVQGSAPFTADEDSYLLPVPVLVIKKLVYVYPDGSRSRPRQGISLGEMLEKRRGTLANGQTVSQPSFTLVGQNLIEVWPAPADGTSLEFWYVPYPDELSDDADVPVLNEPFGSRVLLYAAAVEAARFKKDPLLGDYEATYAYWIDRYQAHLNRDRGIDQFVFGTSGHELVPHDRSTDWYGW